MKRSICSLFVVAALGSVSTSALADNTWKESAKDAWIDGKAETTLLLNGNLDSFDINTDVKNGKVILTGKVESEVDKALAEELIANLDGVKSVENSLTVVNNDSASDEPDDADDTIGSTLKDAKIETVVKTRLLFESEVRGTKIEVEVEKGVVTLTGMVKSSAAKDLAGAIAKGASDVKSVNNMLRIAKG